MNDVARAADDRAGWDRTVRDLLGHPGFFRIERRWEGGAPTWAVAVDPYRAEARYVCVVWGRGPTFEAAVRDLLQQLDRGGFSWPAHRPIAGKGAE